VAIKAVQAAGSAAAGTRTNFLSPEVQEPARLLSLVLMWSGATAGDTIRVFITRSSTEVSEPQPGDPPVVEAFDLRQVITGGFGITIPLMKVRMIQPPFRLAVSYNNTGTADVHVSAVLYYDNEPP
jgi:hypothetical protein